MKNSKRLFGRKLSKLILTPIISFGLVAGFAVSPASADFDPALSPYAGEIAVVQTGNASDGFNLDWSEWIPTARMFDDPDSRETLFDSTGIPFAIVACTNESVVITDCLEGYYNNELEPLTNSTFVGIMRDSNISTGTNIAGTAPTVFRSLSVTRSGSTTPSLQWDENPNAVGYFTDRLNNPTTDPTTPSLFTEPLDDVAYKFYVYIAIPNSLFNPNNLFPAPRAPNYEHPYYASAPISVDFRPLSDAPTISTQPVGASKTVGDSLSLSVSASGSGTLSYQWKKDGSNLSGKTSATLSIPSVATSDAGSYTVDVTNQETGNAPATVTSNAAVVTVTAAPAQGNGPGTEVVCNGPGTEVVSPTIKSKSITFGKKSTKLTTKIKKSVKTIVTPASKSGTFTVNVYASKADGATKAARTAVVKKRAKLMKAYLVKLGVSKSNIKIVTKVTTKNTTTKTKVSVSY